MNKLSQEKVKAIIEAFEAHVPIRLIAEGEQISRATVQRYARLHGYRPTISESMKEYWIYTGRDHVKFPFTYY